MLRSCKNLLSSNFRIIFIYMCVEITCKSSIHRFMDFKVSCKSSKHFFLSVKFVDDDYRQILNFCFRLKSLEEELARIGETNMQLTVDKRRVERERDEAVEQLNVRSNLMNTEDKKRLEAKIYELEELLEEEQNNIELGNDKLKKAQIQVFYEIAQM